MYAVIALRGLIQPTKVGFVAIAKGFSPTDGRCSHPRHRPAHKRAGYGYQGHLRGLTQPTKVGFVALAEGFSPTDGW